MRAGIESGDLLFTAYAAGWVHLWAPDLDIRTALDESRKYIAIIETTDYQNARDAAHLSQQLWANLLGRTSSPMSLSDDEFDERECRERMHRVRNVSGLGVDALYRIVLAVVYGEEKAGFEVLESSRSFVRALAGSPYMVEYCLHGTSCARPTCAIGDTGAGPAAACGDSCGSCGSGLIMRPATSASTSS